MLLYYRTPSNNKGKGWIKKHLTCLSLAKVLATLSPNRTVLGGGVLRKSLSTSMLDFWTFFNLKWISWATDTLLSYRRRTCWHQIHDLFRFIIRGQVETCSSNSKQEQLTQHIPQNNKLRSAVSKQGRYGRRHGHADAFLLSTPVFGENPAHLRADWLESQLILYPDWIVLFHLRELVESHPRTHGLTENG